MIRFALVALVAVLAGCASGPTAQELSQTAEQQCADLGFQRSDPTFGLCKLARLEEYGQRLTYQRALMAQAIAGAGDDIATSLSARQARPSFCSYTQTGMAGWLNCY